MDYYRMQNMQADTTMRENIAKSGEPKTSDAKTHDAEKRKK
jgi:uncharacterized protein YqfA (UPF0365 family)